jgi:hypothetical protein
MAHTGPSWIKINNSKIKKQSCVSCVFYDTNLVRSGFVPIYKQFCHKSEQQIGFSDENPLNLTPNWCWYKQAAKKRKLSKYFKVSTRREGI